ncbi:MAG: 2-hydroxyacyl-CoA dehydratase [Candidatus Thermoplasmatota archaeon]|jgi:benzoyl-CoA reductase/2-hydroxyglutaryl-CoA dehydratase subunit BcrC/BadD/HgdB|nr:2-hydroxyacyl-CoA dehydratase [Candidatus Thermoplasmatota archaeon]
MALAGERRVGITTTVPLEPFLASGRTPVDLNNIFIANASSRDLVEEAQAVGFPRNICSWIKGLHAVSSEVDAVVGVVRGDCSNSESLLEDLNRTGRKVHGFSYPIDRDREELYEEIHRLCSFLGCSMEASAAKAVRLEEIRELAREVDRLRSQHLRISAQESHLAQVSCSDLGSDMGSYERSLEALLSSERKREPQEDGVRLGYIGVPPIITDLFPRLETLGGRTVFFEVQRQFTMPSGRDWVDRYLEYTYPYDIQLRVDDITREIERRNLSGLVHYVQSFCHRQMDDRVFRRELDIPMLTIEGNLPGPLDERTAIRMESFIDMMEGLP